MILDGSQRRYFLKDHLGSVRTTVDQSGNVDGYDDYYPFGLVMPGRSSNSANPTDNYKFTGHERDDEAGLTIDYMMARNYDPMIGRFMQIDPQTHKFPSLTPYHYTYNNPLIYTDPSGEIPIPIAIKGGQALAAAGAAIGAALAATAAYLVIDEVQENRGFFEYVGSTVKEQVSDAWSGLKNLFANEDKTELGDIADDIGEIANIPDLTGKTAEEAGQLLRDAGFERTGSGEAKNKTYKPSNRDGSTITLKPNGEVARVPKTVLDGAGQNVNKGARVIKNNDGWKNTRDGDEKHSSQEKLKIDN